MYLFEKDPKARTKLDPEHRLEHLLRHPAESPGLARNLHPGRSLARNLHPDRSLVRDHRRNPDRSPVRNLRPDRSLALGRHPSPGPVPARDPSPDHHLDLTVNRDQDPVARSRGTRLNQDPDRSQLQGLVLDPRLNLAVDPRRVQNPGRSRGLARGRDRAVVVAAGLVVAVPTVVQIVNK